MTTPKEDDDLPLGLREATIMNYGGGASSISEPKIAPKPVSKPVNVSSDAIIPNAILQSLKGPEIAQDLNNELAIAQKRLADGDKTATKDIEHLLQEIAKSQRKSPMSGLNPTIQNQATEEIDGDQPPGIGESTTMNYGSSKGSTTNTEFPTKLATEIGVGALTGAYVGKKQRKNDVIKSEQEKIRIANLPPEMRPVNVDSLQRYINSQLQHPVPLDKLRELTGMDIRTMSEAQKAIKQIQGSEASRDPIVRNVDGSRRTVAYKTTSAQQPIDISQFAVEPPTFFNKATNALTNTAKAIPSVANKYISPIASGALAVPQLMESGTNYLQNKPVDPTQVASGLGGLAMMSRSPLLSIPGLLAQIPYINKHKNEIANALSMGEINPTAFPLGSPSSMETVGDLSK